MYSYMYVVDCLTYLTTIVFSIAHVLLWFFVVAVWFVAAEFDVHLIQIVSVDALYMVETGHLVLCCCDLKCWNGCSCAVVLVLFDVCL